jgi:hypothetical protein
MLRVTQLRHLTTAVGTIGLFLMSVGRPAADQQPTPTPTPEHFTAFAINMGTAFGVPRTGQSQTVDIVIERLI